MKAKRWWRGALTCAMAVGTLAYGASVAAQDEDPVLQDPVFQQQQFVDEDFGPPEPEPPAPPQQPEAPPQAAPQQPDPAPEQPAPPGVRPGLAPEVFVDEPMLPEFPRMQGLQTPDRLPGGRTNRGEEVIDPVHLDFENVPLNRVIESIGAMTGLNFDIDQNIQTPVTIISHEPIPGDMVYEALEAILGSRGFSLVPSVDGHLIKVVPMGQLTEKFPIYIGSQDFPDGYDRFATYIVGVRYADASELANLLTTLGSQNARVDVYARTNTLIITDVADGIRNMLNLLHQLDVPGHFTDTEIFVLEYTRAATLAAQLQDVLLGPEGVPEPQRIDPQAAAQPPARPTAAQQAAARRRAMIPGQEEPLIVGSRQQTLRIVPDERLNALVVLASMGLMERVRDVIDRLDTPTPYEANTMHIYELLNANAETVAERLNAWFGQAPPREGETQAGPSAQIQPFERQVSISTYDQTNALLIMASPQDYKLIEQIVARLDAPRRQVHVEAIIMEVVVNDNFEFSVESTALSESDFFALNNVVELANVLTQGPLAATGAGFTGGLIDGTTEITLPDGTGGMFTQTIPNVPLLMTMLESMTDLNVLSQPNLLTVNNEVATVLVGQEVPFITGTSRSLDQPAVGASVFSRVDRRDVGIMMEVTPQINEGDLVNLEIEVEVSQTVQSDVGADPNIVGPTLQKTNLRNNVQVHDGSVGIIGGLISESTDHSIRQPPVLGDLPLVGWLFRQRSDRRQKRNLVVLVRPHIVKEARDLERVTQFKLDEFNRRSLDVLFERGFIRKVQQRHHVRTEYRPTEEMTAELMRQDSFSRGDMRRSR